MNGESLRNEKLRDALMEALEIFEEVVPDEECLEEDLGLQEEINVIRKYRGLEHESDIKEALENTVYFIYNWFPDGIGEEEQNELTARLNCIEKCYS